MTKHLTKERIEDALKQMEHEIETASKAGYPMYEDPYVETIKQALEQVLRLTNTPAFSDTADEIEARLESYKDLNCPHCGGSGHIDDIWNPIETAPKDGTQILVFIDSPVTTDKWQDVVYWNDYYNTFMSGLKTVGSDFITHWQPLPQPPKKGE